MSLLEFFLLSMIPVFTLIVVYLRPTVFKKLELSTGKRFVYDICFIVFLIVWAGISQWFMGREVIGHADWAHLISFDTNSKYNSQTLFDPYTFSHILHGFIFFYFFRKFWKKGGLRRWLILAVALETFWEILENTSLVIDHYRTETISLTYYGDSILNSFSDTVFSIFGFFVASKLKLKYVILITLLMELGCIVWIRDSLTLNIIMLLYPLEFIKRWQMGG